MRFVLQAEQKHFILLNGNTSYYSTGPETTTFTKRFSKLDL